jgi:hypothetical protein
MKKGDKLKVSVEGIPVGEAVVEYVADDKVTILVPAMRTVMGLKTQLDPGVSQEPEKEVIVEVERAAPEAEQAVEAVEQPVEAPAAVEGTPGTELKEEAVESKNDESS